MAALLLLLLLVMFPPPPPLEWYVPLKGAWLFSVPWKEDGRHPGEQLEDTPEAERGVAEEEDPVGKEEKAPI